MKYLANLILLVALTGCGSMVTAPPSSTTPTTPAVSTSSKQVQAEQLVFAAKSSYAVALAGAVGYKKMRTCSATVSLPCSNPAVVAQLQKADNVAAASLDAAESAVRTPAIGETALARAVQAAQAALAAFTTLTDAFGVKP